MADKRSILLLLHEIDQNVSELISNYKYKIMVDRISADKPGGVDVIEARINASPQITYKPVRRNNTKKTLRTVSLSPLEEELYRAVEILGITYASKLSTLLRKPRIMVSAYLKRLYEKDLLTQMRTKTRHVAYMPIKLGITALLQHQGEATIQQIANELGIPERNVRIIATELTSNNIIRIVEDKLILNKVKPKVVIFEWNGVLIDDSKFDEKLCEKLAERAYKYNSNRYRSKEHAMIYLRNLLDELENSGDKRWYNYYYLAEQLGVPAKK